MRTMADSRDRRVLSIQSHVVHGYVGNRSATFPLQVLGFEVDVINSVQFSNHTGYKSFKGQVLNAQELGELYDGLKGNSINSYTHLLTGYIGSESFLTRVVDVIKDLKAKNPNLIYVCDPVMGDNGHMYVPEELLPVYKNQIIPLADVVTPNQFEAELLTDMKITDISSAKEAMQKLHAMGAKTVIISSSSLGDQDVLVGLGSSVKTTVVMGSRADGGCGIKMEMAQIPTIFTGTGDLFAALILAWLDAHPDNLKLACEKTISTMQLVLKRTFSYAKGLCRAGEEPNKDQLELRLVQSKKDIEAPELIVTASPL